jgi:hypothetical protein
MRTLLFAISISALLFVGCSDNTVKQGCGCCDACTGLICEGGRCTPCNCGNDACTCPGGKAYKKP